MAWIDLVQVCTQLARGKDHIEMFGKRKELQGDWPPGLAVAQYISFSPLGEVEVSQGKSVESSRHRLKPIGNL